MLNIKNMLKSNFAKNVIVIAGGTAFAQIINTVFSPFLTRIYTPKDYGILTVYLSILRIISVTSSLKYEWAIPIAKNDKEAINILTTSISILLTFTTFIFLLFFFFKTSILNLFNAKNYSHFIILVPIGIFLTGLYNIFIQWSFRDREFSRISKTKINQSLAQNSSRILLGILHFGFLGLIFGYFVGYVVGLITLTLVFIKKIQYFLKHIKCKYIFWSLKRFIRFPIFSTPSQLLNSAGIHLPILFITALFGSQIVGYFGLANNIINIPMILIGNSIGDVFYGEAANIGKNNPKKIKRISLKLFKKLFFIGLMPLIIFVLWGPNIFSIVFGKEWIAAGQYARILVFVVFARMIFTPVSRLYSVYEKQKEAFYIDLLRFLFVLIAFIAAKIFNLSPYFTLALYTLALSTVYLITFLIAQKILNNEIKKLKRIKGEGK